MFFQDCYVNVTLTDATENSYVVSWFAEDPPCEVNVTEVLCSCVGVFPTSDACGSYTDIPAVLEEDETATCSNAYAGFNNLL